MDLIIRDFQKADRFSLMALSDDEWQQQITLLFLKINIDNPIEKCLVAEVNGNIVGFIYGFILPNKTLIPEFMYIKPHYRKNGIGSALIRQLEIHSNCTVSMIFYNKSLHEYYQKRGYQSGDNLEVAMKKIGGDNE